MRHLVCGRCSRRLIENFWVMVRAEPTPTFSSVTLTCKCGEVVSVSTSHDLRRLTPPSDPTPGLAAGGNPM